MTGIIVARSSIQPDACNAKLEAHIEETSLLQTRDVRAETTKRSNEDPFGEDPFGTTSPSGPPLVDRPGQQVARAETKRQTSMQEGLLEVDHDSPWDEEDAPWDEEDPFGEDPSSDVPMADRGGQQN